MSNCIKCGNALSKGRCENLACEWVGGIGAAGAIMLTPARDPELEKMLDAHRKDRERIEFIRRAAIAVYTGPVNCSPATAWEAARDMWIDAKTLWDAKPEDL